MAVLPACLILSATALHTKPIGLPKILAKTAPRKSKQLSVGAVDVTIHIPRPADQFVFLNMNTLAPEATSPATE
ncbi:protein of unknown function [Methylocella tundrae]|uniref:Uncharacterized protein n=1 Tax=Methylocella tundrae TaxID=227605 RepID=A0A4U8YYR8_METTU|nr:protein of unknown function [Methylocella tundrae]